MADNGPTNLITPNRNPEGEVRPTLGSAFTSEREKFPPLKLTPDDKTLNITPSATLVSLTDIVEGKASVNSQSTDPALDRASSARLAQSMLDAITKSPALRGLLPDRTFGTPPMSYEKTIEFLQKVAAVDQSGVDQQLPGQVYALFISVAVDFSHALQDRFNDHFSNRKQQNISISPSTDSLDSSTLSLLLPETSRLSNGLEKTADIVNITLAIRQFDNQFRDEFFKLIALRLDDTKGLLSPAQKEQMEKLNAVFTAFNGGVDPIQHSDERVTRVQGQVPKVLMTPTEIVGADKLEAYRRYFGLKTPPGSAADIYDMDLASKINEFQKMNCVLERAGVFGQETERALRAAMEKVAAANTPVEKIINTPNEFQPNGEMRYRDLVMLRSVFGTQTPQGGDALRYDAALVGAVKTFQETFKEAFQLRTDGVLDSNTMKAITEYRLQKNLIALRPGREFPEGFVAEKRAELLKAIASFPLTEYEKRVITRAQNSRYPDAVNTSFTQTVHIFQKYSGANRPDGIFGAITALQLLNRESGGPSAVAKIMVPSSKVNTRTITAQNEK